MEEDKKIEQKQRTDTVEEDRTLPRRDRSCSRELGPVETRQWSGLSLAWCTSHGPSCPARGGSEQRLHEPSENNKYERRRRREERKRERPTDLTESEQAVIWADLHSLDAVLLVLRRELVHIQQHLHSYHTITQSRQRQPISLNNRQAGRRGRRSLVSFPIHTSSSSICSRMRAAVQVSFVTTVSGCRQ